MKKKLIAVAVTVSMVGCAATGHHYRPVIDLQNVNLARYEHDLHECQEYSNQVIGPAGGAAAGAVLGLLLGAAVGRAAGSNQPWSVGRSTAVMGAAGGAGGGVASEANVMRNCMMGRGYRVLQ